MADTASTEEHTGVGVFLLPQTSDPIIAASSEPAHLTTVWMGDMNDVTEAELTAILGEVRSYATALDGPVVVPTASRGVLGADEADVVFLERTDALQNLRQGLLESSPTVSEVMNRVEQYPEWTPHVTMGYPETPALAEYDGDAVSFDRVGVWVGPDQHEYPMGGDMTAPKDQAALLAAARVRLEGFDTAGVVTDPPISDTSAPEVDTTGAETDTMPDDELDDGEELITEIPVHGIATLEGKPTGDGRGFRPGALSFGRLPAPLGYEFESGHGSDNSRVAIVGRIDEFWTVPSPTEGDGVFEVRWRGVIMPGKEWGARAIESIVDGSYDGLSIIIDSVTRDVSEELAAKTAEIEAIRAGEDGYDNLSAQELADMIVGDGTTDVRWLSAAQIRRFDMVPTGAFQEGYVALGSEFPDELTVEQLAIAASAMEDCGCTELQAEGEAIIAGARWFEAMRAVPADERKRLADSGAAMPDGSFPIANVDDLRNAIQAVGRAKDPTAARAHIKKRARELGEEALIPDGWSVHVAATVGEDGRWRYADGSLASDQDAAAAIWGESFAPGTHDGPGWITNPIPTSRIRRYWVKGAGAAKIGWGTPGDFNRCRMQLAKYVANPDWLAGLCSNMHKEALGVWPGQETARGRHSLTASAAPLFTLVAAVAPVDASFFKRRELENPRVGLVVDDDAVYGYIAQWNVCHIGQPEGAGTCTMAPPSSSNYGMFRTGTVQTTEGPVAVGQLTMSTGHANTWDSARAAASHYDDTGAAIADVVCGEDSFGIWFAGRIRPSATDEQRYELAASGRLSGDWRPVGGRYEMIAALVVNVPGFPIPEVAIAASASGVGAIVAAGIIRPEEANEPAPKVSATLSAEDIAGIAIAAAETVIGRAMSALRGEVNLDTIGKERVDLTPYSEQVSKLADGGIVTGESKVVVVSKGDDIVPLRPELAAARAAYATRALATARAKIQEEN